MSLKNVVLPILGIFIGNMQVFHEIIPLQKFLEEKKCKSGNKIGLIPTMGALHNGHLSLINRSLKENDVTVCSIYVNPAQFNNSQDLQQYPRDITRDRALLEKAGCQVLFCPDDRTMYPEETTVRMEFGRLETVMEGAFRPGHFSGVALVVAKLFHIVRPDNAYFGQKDLQQYFIIKRMVSDLSFNVNLICQPVVREPDGLAMSSRNSRLSPEQRAVAPIFYKALSTAALELQQGNSIAAVTDRVNNMFREKDVKLEYFEVVEGDSLLPVKDVDRARELALCIAGYVGAVRLIDNLRLFL